MRPSKQELRSEETKRAVLAAASTLFTERGYDAVTMREIARAAGCSHTTIYLYFKDKEALLHQLSMGPLQSLHDQLESLLLDKTQSPENRLRSVTRSFIRFCLLNRNMYSIFFMTRASRVDEADPAMEIQKIRNEMFRLLQRGIQECLPSSQSDNTGLAFARIYFYYLQGIVGCYTINDEPFDLLMERLDSTFDLGVQVLLAGFKQHVQPLR